MFMAHGTSAVAGADARPPVVEDGRRRSARPVPNARAGAPPHRRNETLRRSGVACHRSDSAAVWGPPYRPVSGRRRPLWPATTARLRGRASPWARENRGLSTARRAGSRRCGRPGSARACRPRSSGRPCGPGARHPTAVGWTVRMSAPRSSMCVAKLWRRTCGLTGRTTPAALAARRTAFWTPLGPRWWRRTAPERGSTDGRRAANTYRHPYSVAAFGYFRASAPGRLTAAVPSATSASYRARSAAGWSASGSSIAAGSTVTRSPPPFPSRTRIWPRSRSRSWTRRPAP